MEDRCVRKEINTMKKIIAFLFAVLLTIVMAVPAFACTPKMEVPEVPQTSKIEFKIDFKLPDNFWNNFKFNFGG